MIPEQMVGNIVDHIFDAEGEDGTVTQAAYTGVVIGIMEKNKVIQKKEYLKLFVTLVYNNAEDVDDD